MRREWRIAEVWSGRDELAAKLDIHPIVAQILHNRGVSDADSAKMFMDPKLTALGDPEDYLDLLSAAKRIVQAIRQREKIVVYSDYDVDGVCGAAILHHVITRADGDLEVYIPHRVEEGYGLSQEAISRLIDEGANVLITVDCGIRDHDIIAHATERGMDVIVTDHHEAATTYPPAMAVIHPARRTAECLDKPNGDVNPCGATVAFKLAWAIAKEISGGQRVGDDFRELLVEMTALAALATIADVVPLLAENRVLTKFGLLQLARTKLVGLRALLDSAKLTDKINSFHVGFVLAPRINAAGRMGHAREAFELLIGTDAAKSKKLAEHLDKQNKRRQKLEENIMSEAIEIAEYQGQGTDDMPVLVLAKEGWHVGVIGIVASKLVDRLDKPVIMIALTDGYGQGSARSVEGFDINQAIEKCGQHLLGFGGHAMAAGLQIDSGKIIPFMQQLQEVSRSGVANSEPASAIKVDAEVTADDINANFIWQLQQLGPFGQGNPRPSLAGEVVDLAGEPKVVGNAGKHLSFNVRWGGRVFRAIAFNQAGDLDVLLDHRRCRLVFEPVVDEYYGRGAIQLRVKSIKPME